MVTSRGAGAPLEVLETPKRPRKAEPCAEESSTSGIDSRGSGMQSATIRP